jgi:hypothetical protein
LRPKGWAARGDYFSSRSISCSKRLRPELWAKARASARRRCPSSLTDERIAYKYYILSWQLDEAQRKGLTRPQFVRYDLMRLGVDL